MRDIQPPAASLGTKGGGGALVGRRKSLDGKKTGVRTKDAAKKKVVQHGMLTH